MEEMGEDPSVMPPDRPVAGSPGDSLPSGESTRAELLSAVKDDGGPPTAEVPVTVLLDDSLAPAGAATPASEATEDGAPAGAAMPASEATEDGAPASGKRHRFPVITPLSAAAALVIAALAASLIVALLDLSQKNAADSARTSAVKAASSYAVEIGSYNYRHLQQDFNLVKSHSTPSFRASFSQSSDALSSLLSKYHATAAGTVAAAGVVSASPTKAVVIVFLNQKVTNTAKTGGASTDHLRLEMTLDNSSGHWLIDKVKLL